MIETDVVIIGSGIAALKAYKDFYDLGYSAIIIDPGPLGGSVSSVGTSYKFPKIPILIDYGLRNMFEGCEFSCYPIELNTIKMGDIVSKMLGFERFEPQRLWFYDLFNMKKACFTRNIVDCVIRNLGISYYLIKRIVSGIRRIYLDTKIITLSIGLAIKYKKVVYTWPLDILRDFILTRKNELYLALDDVAKALKYASLFIRAYVTREGIEGYGCKEKKMNIYLHSTKASRFHTAIKIPLHEDVHVLYAVTSYSQSYPLLPGIGEKIDSELKKHGLLRDFTRALEIQNIDMRYGILNKIDRKSIETLKELLSPFDIKLFGRLAEWTDYDIPTIIFKQTALS
ncbi:MAG: hypothetical protein QW632_02635 [Ignisphaera sp.]